MLVSSIIFHLPSLQLSKAVAVNQLSVPQRGAALLQACCVRSRGGGSWWRRAALCRPPPARGRAPSPQQPRRSVLGLPTGPCCRMCPSTRCERRTGTAKCAYTWRRRRVHVAGLQCCGIWPWSSLEELQPSACPAHHRCCHMSRRCMPGAGAPSCSQQPERRLLDAGTLLHRKRTRQAALAASGSKCQ
jgi:hypothetical protein